MNRRIFFAQVVAICLLLAIGVALWFSHLGATTALLDAQISAGRTLLTQSPAADPALIVRAVARPGITAALDDRTTRTHYEWAGDQVIAHPFGPPPAPPGGPPPQSGPPAEKPGQPPDAPPPRRGSSFSFLVADLAHITPRRVETQNLTLILLPATDDLARWFLVDLLLCALAIALVLLIVRSIATAIQRAALLPLLQTTNALERLATGDFTPQQVEPGGAQHIARLAHAYNAAAATVAASIEERRTAAAEYRRFLADAGHEMRTPLTILGGYIDILAQELQAGDVLGRRVTEGMRSQAKRMRLLVEKMLMLARVEARSAAPSLVSVATVLHDVAIEMRQAFAQRTISYDAVPEARVRIDEDDLFEALRNLVENALRYAPASDVGITAKVQAGQVIISVFDQGPGIPEQEQPMIFERFYRGTQQTGIDGSGLGLSIVRGVSQRWGGSVSVASSPLGTRFTITFPLAAEVST